MRDARAIGPVGTAGRLLIGAFFLGPYLMFWASPGPLDFVAGLLLFPAAFIVAQGTYQALVGGRLEATGPWAMAANVAVAVLLFSIDATRPATAIFLFAHSPRALLGGPALGVLIADGARLPPPASGGQLAGALRQEHGLREGARQGLGLEGPRGGSSGLAGAREARHVGQGGAGGGQQLGGRRVSHPPAGGGEPA